MYAWFLPKAAGCFRLLVSFAAGALAILLLSGAAPFRLDRDIVADTPAASAAQMAREADYIAVGQFSNSVREIPTGRSIPQGRLVNYEQVFSVKRLLKGPVHGTVSVVTTGVNPLPPPSEKAVNERYPGAWASDQDYLLFLRKLEGRNSYQLLGLLNGLYPIQEGKTVKLENQGFPELNAISQQDLPAVLERLGR